MDTNDDADGDVDMDRMSGASKASPSPELCVRHLSAQAHRAIGIISDSPDNGLLEVNADAHIINDDSSSIIGGDGVGVEDGIVSLETNDDVFFRAFSRCGKGKKKGEDHHAIDFTNILNSYCCGTCCCYDTDDNDEMYKCVFAHEEVDILT
jgi:hypothetical protein